MSTPEAADATVRIGLLLEAVESQRALAAAALAQLAQHTAGLDSVEREEIRATLAEELGALGEEGRRTAARLREATRAVQLRHLAWGVVVAVLSTGLPLALAAWLLPSRAEVAALRQTRAELSATVARLAAQGGRAQLRRCGSAARLCVRIDRAAPSYGEHGEFAVVQGY